MVFLMLVLIYVDYLSFISKSNLPILLFCVRTTVAVQQYVPVLFVASTPNND